MFLFRILKESSKGATTKYVIFFVPLLVSNYYLKKRLVIVLKFLFIGLYIHFKNM